MFRVDLSDLLRLCAVPVRSQVAVIGENRAVKSIAVHIIRAYLQAQPALKAPGRRIIMRIIDVCLRMVFPLLTQKHKSLRSDNDEYRHGKDDGTDDIKNLVDSALRLQGSHPAQRDERFRR